MVTHNAVREALRCKALDTTSKSSGRAQDILAAARKPFASQGYAGLSMRAVAVRIGATLDSMQHDCPTKDELPEAMLVHSIREY